jgi:RNA polymerase sigma-70 factor (ECF subfamily)
MSAADNSQLESRIRAGDVEALAELVALNKSRLMAALERKVGPGLRRKLELEDVLQEALARAVKDLPSVDFAGQDPMGWLYQVIDRQIVDLHRFHFEAKKRDAGREISANQPIAGMSEERGFADLLVASMTSPSAAVSRDMRLQRVYNALEKLSEDMRNAIRWRYLENLPSQEIAVRLGKSDVATRVLLSRAINKLQATLAEK